MDLLARRDHSPLEIQRKLSKFFSREEIDEALEWARQNKWMPEGPEALSKFAEKWRPGLDRRKKGIRWINQKLAHIGLPHLNPDPVTELEKAKELIERRTQGATLQPEMRGKLQRFLQSRGFEGDIIRKAMKDLKFSSSGQSEVDILEQSSTEDDSSSL